MKLKLSAVILTLLFALLPFTAISAQAETFSAHFPSYGLHCENENAILHGNVKFVVDENAKAVQYSEYEIGGCDKDLEFYVPFVPENYINPQIEFAVNGKAATSELCYGERYTQQGAEYCFYSSVLDEELTGTLYTLTAEADSFTVEFTKQKSLSFIYRFNGSVRAPSGSESYSYTLAYNPESVYEIFVIDGDFTQFNSTAQVQKQTVSVKEYVDRNFNEFKDIFSGYGFISAGVIYSLINRAAEQGENLDFYYLFVDSFFELRLNARKLTVKAENLPCTVSYSMPAFVQPNGQFAPEIYIIEHSAGSCAVDYSVQLNEKLPFVIESSAEMQNQSGYLYTAGNVSSDFYSVFSSSQKPESVNGKGGISTLRIVLYTVAGAAVCGLIAFGVILLVKTKKSGG